MNLSSVLPKDVTSDQFPGEELFGATTVACSNAIRNALGIPQSGLVTSALPRFVTRANPSVDNYMADLLLRSSYPATNYVPEYDECILRGDSAGKALAEVNPSLVGSVLLGVGRDASLDDVAAVYDEHNADGTRAARAACEVVHLRHIVPANLQLPQGYLDVMEEICEIDSKGNQSSSASIHLNSLTKALHTSRLRLPGHASERLYSSWKRAIIEACLTATILENDSIADLTKDELQVTAQRFWNDDYIPRMWHGLNSKYWGFRKIDYVNEVRDQLLRIDTSIHLSKLSISNLICVMKRVWPEDTAHFLLTLLIEGSVQSQMTFHHLADLVERTWNSPSKSSQKERLNFHPIKLEKGGQVYHWVIIYEMKPSDSLPNRGLLSALGKNSVKGILVIRNPQTKTMAIFPSGHHPTKLEAEIWKNFADKLEQREPGRWYSPRSDKGQAPFILNGTESLQLPPPSRILNREIIRMFATTVEAYVKRTRRR
jgi:hypothetical protein